MKKPTQRQLARYARLKLGSGCYLNRSVHSAESLECDTINFARVAGFTDEFDPHFPVDEEELNCLANDALYFLNELETRVGYFWTFNDNSLFLMENGGLD